MKDSALHRRGDALEEGENSERGPLLKKKKKKKKKGQADKTAEKIRQIYIPPTVNRPLPDYSSPSKANSNANGCDSSIYRWMAEYSWPISLGHCAAIDPPRVSYEIPINPRTVT